MNKRDENKPDPTIIEQPAPAEKSQATIDREEARAEKARIAEREAQIAEGNRVFTETAEDVRPFEPVYADHQTAEPVNVRELQGQDATKAIAAAEKAAARNKE